MSNNQTNNEILQENHYYPFGLNTEGPWMNDAVIDNKYQYNGKELNMDHGLGWYDYGARWYDAAVGKWVSVDPIARYAESYSSYSYAQNNPINYIDPNGAFRIPDEFRSAYPNLVRYLETQLLSHIQESQEISGAIYFFSGFSLNSAQLIQDFSDNNGPLLKADDQFADGRYEHYNRSIVFNNKVLDKIEKILRSGSEVAQQIALIEFMTIFVNEYVHYGDALDNADVIMSLTPPFLRNDYGPDGQEPARPNRFEEGNAARDFIYPLSSPEQNYTLFKTGRIVGKDGKTKGEDKSRKKDSTIPPPPRT